MTLIPETSIELVRAPSFRGAPRFAVIDFDGTLSLIRGGWTEVMVGMMVDHLVTLPRATEPVEQLRAHVTDFVLALNGEPTIYQMRRFAEEIAHRGGTPDEPTSYHQEYLRRLGERVEQRKTSIRSGVMTTDDHLVPGARALLTGLQDRGVELILASGTEIDFLREEAAVLDIDHFFGSHIYGPPMVQPETFSKRQVMQAATERHGSTAFVSIGDGVVETECAASLGGLAIGVASDELHRSGQPEPWKRERLIAAGAHLIAPDFRDVDALLRVITTEAQGSPSLGPHLH